MNKIIIHIIEIVATLVEIMVLYKILNTLFEKKEHRSNKYILNNKTLIVCAVTVITHMLNMVDLFSYGITLFIIIYATVTGYYLFSAKILHLFIVSEFYYVSILLLDFLVMGLASRFGNNPQLGYLLTNHQSIERLYYIVFMKIVLVTIYYLIRKGLDKVEYFHIYVKGLVFFSIIGISIISMYDRSLLLLFQVEYYQVWLKILLIMLVVFTIFVYYSKYKDTSLKAEYTIAYSESLKESYNSLNQLYIENAHLFHDFNNHLSTLSMLIQAKQYEKAEKYIHGLVSARENINIIQWTDNDVVNFIVNIKYSLAKKKDIDMKIDIDLYPNEFIDNKDMCIILGNLLDNAIEACALVKTKRYIDLKIRTVNNIIFVKLINSVHAKPKIKNGVLISSKNNKWNHGIGLASVQAAIDKYNGYLDLVFHEEYAEANITLYFN